jgi:hypothetical protein
VLRIATVGFVAGLRGNGAIGTQEEPAVFRRNASAWRILVQVNDSVHLYTVKGRTGGQTFQPLVFVFQPLDRAAWSGSRLWLLLTGGGNCCPRAANRSLQRILGFVVFRQSSEIVGAGLRQVLLGLNVLEHDPNPILFALPR